VNSLAKLTALGRYIEEIQFKNIECIRTLLSVALVDGEFLAESWGPVLQCISQLAKLHLSASRLASDDEFLVEDEMRVTKNEESAFKFFRTATASEIAKEMEETNGRVVLAAVNGVLIDKVFSFSANLSTLGLIHFIEQLILVSKSEIAGESKMNITGISQQLNDSNHKNNGVGSRIFSLQRLVEVADYNMDVRPRIAWIQIWETMSKYFATIGCHSNSIVSMFAIDALRQLSFKFLEKPELSDFNFQRLFLRPFLLIMENQSSRDDIRELILRCMDNMIRLMNSNLRSGWKIILECITLSATDPCEKNSILGLAILQRLLDEHLDSLISPLDSTCNKKVNDLSTIERRQRNVRVEDFCSLCRTSLAFVQIDEREKPISIGLCMRALCNISCFADLIAAGKIQPPVGHSQTHDPYALGYTYADLPSVEEKEYMALWRPMMDGLASGICASVRSNSDGAGCLIQRGCIIVVRSILLRHEKLFTVAQWKVLLECVILPSIQRAAENDHSPLIEISSENPLVSSFDFLVDALPLPPPHDDESLQKFAKLQTQSNDRSLNRPLGVAELLVEASFADLRHGGDGDLNRNRVNGQASKQQNLKKNAHDQPFPDSWIATSASIALGTLTDIIGEILFHLDEEGRTVLWPIVLRQYNRWILGKASEKNMSYLHDWRPCEALVRIACKEFSRFSLRLANTRSSSKLLLQEVQCWFSLICSSIAETISLNSALASMLQEEMIEAKLSTLGLKKGLQEMFKTPYGIGEIVATRLDWYNEASVPEVIINQVRLEWGATLYGLSSNISVVNDSNDNAQSPVHEGNVNTDLSPEKYINRYVPALKTRCIAAFLLQSYLPQSLNALAELIRKDDANVLLFALEKSRLLAQKACKDSDLSHAFQESTRSNWVDGGVEEVEARLAAFIVGGGAATAQQGDSEMYFLIQESWANRAIIHLLSLLYCSPDSFSNIGNEWDSRTFSEQLLMERILDVVTTFLQSEKTDGANLDANMWKRTNDLVGKIAFYCTSFASVVVTILFTFLKFSPDQFKKHKNVIFRLLTDLISVKSDEIRQLVQEVMEQQVAPLLS